MARIDKYDSQVSGFRAPLAATWAGSTSPFGVGLDVNGRMVIGAGHTGIIGVLCKPRNPSYGDMAAGEVVDIVRIGELVEFAGVAGTVYTANTTTGVISAAAPSGTQIVVGFTVEATRLIVGVAA